ncbi:transglutaminaseTgpA domain-containing protein [Cryptosporangium sp. NPDC051539]|uniref:transglutaminase family protein n=1 Tax=Cryptosporangium sp. NPDC051539 TaxID=3363962 RepID=UPI003794BAA8
MNRRTYVSVVAGAATLLAATSLSGIFDGMSWFPVVAGSVIVVTLAGLGARALRTPPWLQPVVGAVAVLLYTTIVFGHDRFLGIVPTPATITGLRADVQAAFADIAELAAPVPPRPGILLLTVAGVGLVAILVDLLASVLGRAALAGLPLLGLYTVPVAVDREGIGWIPFALGAAGFCWLLSAEHGTTIRRWGRPFRSGSAAEPSRSGSLVAGRLAVFGIVLAVLLPAGVPALSAEGLHSLFNGGLPGTGNGRTVTAINPVTELRGQLTQSEPVELLRIRSSDPDPFYLRLATLERFTGNGWTLKDMSAKPEARVSNGVPNVSGISGGTPTRSQKTTVEIRGLSQSRYLPLYSNPTAVAADGDWRFDRGSEAVFSTVDTTKNMKYTFESRRVLYTAQMLRSAPPPPTDGSIVRYTQLDNPEPSVKKQVQELVAGKSNEYDRAVALNNFFAPENGFVYDLQTQAGTSQSDIVNFLDKRRGYCEQYASAMAYMARVAGLPARVAIGFGYGTPQGNYTTITSHDAHAWVEVYFSGIGWVPFDPTPPTGQGRTGDLAWVDNNVSDQGQSTEQTAPDEREQAAGPSSAAPEPEPSDDAAAAATSDDKSAGDSASLLKTIRTILVWVLGVLIVLALAITPALVRRRVRARRLAALQRPDDPSAAAHAAWDEVLDTLVDLDAGGDSGETPRGLSKRLSSDGLDGSAQGALTLLAHAEEQARYAPRVAATPGLAEAVVAVRAALHQKSPRRRRIMADWAPASTLERVGSAVRSLPAKARGK